MSKILKERIGVDKVKLFLPYVSYNSSFFIPHGNKIINNRSTQYIMHGPDYRITLYCSVNSGYSFMIKGCHLEIWIDDEETGNLQNFSIEDLQSKVIDIVKYEELNDGLILNYMDAIYTDMEVNCTFAVKNKFDYYVPALLHISNCLYNKTMKQWYQRNNNKRSSSIKWPETDKISSISMKNKMQGYSLYDKSKDIKKKKSVEISINTIRIEWKLKKIKIKEVFNENSLFSISDQMLSEAFLKNFIKKVEKVIDKRYDIEFQRYKEMYKSSFSLTTTGKKRFEIDKFCYCICQFCRDNNFPPFLDVDDVVKDELKKHDKAHRNGERTFKRFEEKFCNLDKPEHIHSKEPYEEIVDGIHRCAENADTGNGIVFEVIKETSKNSLH